MMAGTFAKVSVLLRIGRPLPETLFDRARRLGARLAAHAHDRVHQRRAFAADVGAAAGPHSDLDVLAAAENVLADQAQPLGVGDRFPEALDGQRILAADVVVCPLGAADDAGDEHPFEDLVRIALVDTAILVDVRLALVRVDGDELRRDSRLAAALPLDAGREPRAAAAAQIRRPSPRRSTSSGVISNSTLLRRAVGAAGDGILDGVGFDDAEILHDDADADA